MHLTNNQRERGVRCFVESKRSNQATVFQARKITMLGFLLFSVMFVMYGIGFYYGAILINEQRCFFGQDHLVYTVGGGDGVVGIGRSSANHMDR